MYSTFQERNRIKARIHIISVNDIHGFEHPCDDFSVIGQGTIIVDGKKEGGPLQAARSEEDCYDKIKRWMASWVNYNHPELLDDLNSLSI